MAATIGGRWRWVRPTIVHGLAIVGASALAGLGMLGCTRKMMYAVERIRTVPAPGDRLRVVGEVTHGGLGTVWTTRLYVEDRRGGRDLIYENRDSDYVPAVRWTGPERLTVLIHCGRADHLANPGAYADAPDPLGRLRVRFVYHPQACARSPVGDQ